MCKALGTKLVLQLSTGKALAALVIGNFNLGHGAVYRV